MDDGVLARHYKYDEYKQASKDMFTKTDAEDGVHWQEIDTTSLPATAKVLDVLVSLLKNKVEKERVVVNFKEIFHPQNFLISAMPRLWQKWCFSVFG